MEILAYIAIAVILILIGVKLSQHLKRKYNFTTFSGKAIGLLVLTAIAWTLTYYFYKPNGNENAIINFFARLFVIGFDALIPLYLLITNIRKTNLFWGLIAFFYQVIATASAAIFIVLIFARLSED